MGAVFGVIVAIGLDLGNSLGILGIVKLTLEKNRLGLVILFWGLIPLLLSMAFLKTFTARYLLIVIPPFLIFAGFELSKILDKVNLINIWKIIIALALILPLCLIFDYQLITNPPPQSLPKEERIGYFEDWTAGYGFSEIAKYLMDRRKIGPVVVGTEGFFGTLPDGLQIYLDKSGIPVLGSTASISAQLKKSSLDNQTFFVANRARKLEHQKDLKLIMEFPKTRGEANQQDAIQLFEISQR